MRIKFYLTFFVLLLICLVTGLVACDKNDNYTSQTNLYTITWKNGEEILKTEQVEYGQTPFYDGIAPIKEKTAQYEYTFSGWYPIITPVTGDVVYVAQFFETTNLYTITWKNGEEILKTEQVEYGQTPFYGDAVPIREKTSQYSYTFNGWYPNIAIVTEDMTYEAQFVEEDINFFIFSKTKNKFETNNNVTELINTIENEKDETFSFVYSNYKNVLGRWGQLNKYGYFFNKDLICGIKSIIIETINADDSFIVSFGYKEISGTISFIDSVEYTGCEILDIPDTCNYIKIFNASNSDIIINEIKIKYNNEIAIEPNKNDALYTFTINTDNVSCKITGVENCSEIENAYLSSYYQGYKITEIKDGCFQNCSNLKSLSIPFISLKDYPNGSQLLFFGRLFGSAQFENATCVQQKYPADHREVCYNYYLPNDLKEVHIEKGYTTRTFWGCSTIEKVTFGDGIDAIGSYCFSGCSMLCNFVFGPSIKTINGGAFQDCVSLKDINLKSNITTIGYEAFGGCSFDELIIPDNITTLSAHAFYNCNIINKIYIPKSVKSIGRVAFDHVNKPTIYCEVEEKPAEWNSEWNYYNNPVVWGYYGIIDNYLACYRNEVLCLLEYNGENSNVICTPTESGITENYALYSNLFVDNNTIETVVISKECNLVKNDAFINCNKMKHVIICNGNITLEMNAFSGTNLIECLYFYGDIEEWNHSIIYNNYIVSFYSENKFSDETVGIYYWHYENGIPVITY